jgi:hypothetical protein
MVTAPATFQPFGTTNVLGSFDVSSVGLVQGTAYPDPAIMFKLAHGVLAQAETLPMFGGIGIYTDIPPAGSVPLGTPVGRATSLSNLIGFSVFDLNYAAVNNPTSPVPTSGSGMQVNYYRLGSGARVALKCDPALISLQSGLTTQSVSWDFVNQKIIPYQVGTAIVSATYNSGTGAVVLTFAAPYNTDVGDTIVVSGATGTGTFATINGNQQVTAVAGNTVTYNVATGQTMTITGATVGTSGILPVQILDIQEDNCITVALNPSTGAATWSLSDCCAVALL